jgi:acyl carrier protein
MDDLAEKIKHAIREIQEQQGYRIVELDDKMDILNTLGFQSLDIAQLIAMLELDLGVDPFSNGASLSELTTIKNLYEIYNEAIILENEKMNLSQ